MFIKDIFLEYPHFMLYTILSDIYAMWSNNDIYYIYI